MADIRIKDLATTASVTASDDFMAVDGTTSGTRKLSAATPSFATSVTVPGVSGPTSTDLTLAGGSTGASLVLGNTAGAATLNRGLTVALTGTSGTTDTALNLTTTQTTAGSGTKIRFGSTTYAGLAEIHGGNVAGGQDGFLDLYVRTGGTPTQYVRATSTGNLLIGGTTDITGSGGLKVYGTTAASSTTSGALQVAGGVGVAGAGYFGGDLFINKTTPVLRLQESGSTQMALIYFSGNSFFDYTGTLTFRTPGAGPSAVATLSNAGVLNLQNTTSATSSTVGALTIGNGTAATNVAIGGGNINAGGTGTFGTNATGGILRLGGTAPSADQPAEIFLTTSNTAFNWKVLTNTSGPGIFELRQSTAGGGTTFTDAILRITPNVTASASAVGIGGIATIASTTASTGVGTGALQVAGGIYAGAASVFAGAVTAGGLYAGTGSSGAIEAKSSSAGVPVTISAFNTSTSASSDVAFGLQTQGSRNANWLLSRASGLLEMTDGYQTRGNVRVSFDPLNGNAVFGGTATFAGAVTTGGDITASSAASIYLRVTSSNNNAAPGTIYTSGNGGSLQTWLVGSNVSGASGEFAIRDSTAVANALTITKSTLAATFAGTVIAPAATASLAPLRIPHGTAPTSPTNGDMWTTTAGLYIRINGATVGPLS